MPLPDYFATKDLSRKKKGDTKSIGVSSILILLECSKDQDCITNFSVTFPFSVTISRI